jgi:hypothetical protein
MEYFSAIAGKWMELEIIMLSGISQHHKRNITCLLSFVEARRKQQQKPWSTTWEVREEGERWRHHR